MRIGLVLPSVPAYSETFFRSKIRGLQANGHEVLLFVGRKPGKTSDLIECPVYFTEIGTSLWSRLLKGTLAFIRASWKAPKASLKLFQLHRKEGDRITTSLRSIIINSHILSHPVDWLHFGFATMGVGREFVGRAIGAKVAVSFRGYDINQYPLNAGLDVYQRLWAATNKVHSISNCLVDTAIEKLRFPRNLDTEIITPAIDVDRFKIYQIKEKFTDANIKCLIISRLHWIKNIESSLEAIAILRKKGFDIQLTIVGSGKEEERLKFAAKQLDIHTITNWVGQVSHSDIPDIMAQHDIFIQYSLEEGFCNAVLEAQAAGLLVLVSDARGLLENVEDGETAWVVPKLNPRALSCTILEVMQEDSKKRMNIQNAARERVVRYFQISDQQKAFQNFYGS